MTTSNTNRPKHELPIGPRRATSADMAERRARAWQLRVMRKTYRQIAAELEVSVETAYSYVQHHYREVEAATAETAREAKTRDLEMIDQMIDRLTPLALPEDITKEPDFQAVTQITKLLDRRAKLLGLDAPVQSEVSGPNGGPIPVASTTVLVQLQSGETVDALELMREKYNEHAEKVGKPLLDALPEPNGHQEEGEDVNDGS